MKRILFVLSIIFIILTFAGAAYVILNNGTVNAGYAVIPMLFSITTSTCYRQIKSSGKDT